MPRPKRIFKIECFYCHKLFEYAVGFVYYIKKAHCNECKKIHAKYLWQKNRVMLGKYREYLEKVKNQLGQRKKETTKLILHRKDGKLFRGEIDLGRIVKEDAACVYVQRWPMGQICSYQRAIIK